MRVCAFAAAPLSSPRDGVIEVARGDTRAALLEGRLHPDEVIGRAGQRHTPVALERIEAEGIFVSVASVDGVVVIEAVDARARPVAGDDDRRVLWRLIGDDAGGDAPDGEKLGPRGAGVRLGSAGRRSQSRSRGRHGRACCGRCGWTTVVMRHRPRARGSPWRPSPRRACRRL